MTEFELKDIDLEHPVVAGFMKKKSLKRKKVRDIATREKGHVEAHKGGDSASVPIEIPKLPQVSKKKNRNLTQNLKGSVRVYKHFRTSFLKTRLRYVP